MYKMAAAKEDISFLISFVNHVEKYPCLWNYTLKTYNKSEATGSAWKSIAADLKDTEHNCRDRWKNIRCAYVRSLKPSKSGTKSKKTYYLAEHLSFLIPYMKAYNASGKVTTPSTEENDDDNEYSDEPPNDSETEPESTAVYEFIHMCESNLMDNVMSASKAVSDETSRLTESKRKEPPQNDTDPAFSEWLQMKKQNLGKQRSDADLMFFHSLIPDLQKLDARRKRYFKAKTMDLLNTMLDETETDGLPIKNE